MEIILVITSICTAVISAVTGMGGGILLLSVMTFFMPSQTIIPIHGFVQLISNSTRALYLKDHVKWKFFLYYIIGLPIGALFATLLLKNLFSEEYIYTLLLVILCYAIFKPKKLPELKLREPYWLIVGFITGILAILIGAVGPFLAAFFIRDDFEKEEIVSTKSMMQLSAHFIKIPAFLYLDFPYSDYTFLIVIMSVGVIIGTKYGVKLLKNVDPQLFKKLYKFVLFIAALRILIKLING